MHVLKTVGVLSWLESGKLKINIIMVLLIIILDVRDVT